MSLDSPARRDRNSIGLDFYHKVVELQKRYNVHNVQISNAIQTNGMLLDETWAEFFRQERFLVGISLDGFKDNHNRYRTDSKGR